MSGQVDAVGEPGDDENDADLHDPLRHQIDELAVNQRADAGRAGEDAIEHPGLALFDQADGAVDRREEQEQHRHRARVVGHVVERGGLAGDVFTLEQILESPARGLAGGHRFPGLGAELLESVLEIEPLVVAQLDELVLQKVDDAAEGNVRKGREVGLLHLSGEHRHRDSAGRIGDDQERRGTEATHRAEWLGVGTNDQADVGGAPADQLTHIVGGQLLADFAQGALGAQRFEQPPRNVVVELVHARLRDEAVEAVLAQGRTQNLIELMHLLTKGQASRSIAELVRNTVSSLYGLFQETEPPAWHGLKRSKLLSDAEIAELLEELRCIPMPDKRFITARDKDIDRAAAGDWEAFVGGGLAAKVLDETYAYFRKDIPDAAVALYRPLLQQARSVIVGRLALQNEATYELLKKYDVEYQRLKRERRALRFDDVTRRLADSAALGGIERVAFRLDARCDHLLLDEFQDTAPAQWQVVRPFAERVTAAGAGRSFFCVGDVKQAIYGWRGGVAEIFDAIDAQLANLTHDQLNTSYRSAPAVIDTVNAIFTGIARHPNLDRLETALQNWCARFSEHSTARTGKAGYATLVTAPEEMPLLEFAAAQVAEIVARAPGRSVGVLVRRNQAIVELIYHLRALGINASEEGGNPLTDSAAVLAVLSLLRLADHPSDTVARFHVAHSPLAEIVGLADYRHDGAASRAAQKVRRLLVERGYGATIYEWARALAPHTNRRELSRLQQLVEMAYAYQDSATLRSDDFRALVESQRVSDPTAADVRVMTIHQAKGLEFDMVVLPELDGKLVGQPDSFVVGRRDPTAPPESVCRYVASDVQALLPESFQQMFADATDRTMTEALCVLYVAITRAAHALHMIIPPAGPRERNLPKTFAGLLRAALANNLPATPGEKLYGHGDPDWHLRGRSRSACVGIGTRRQGGRRPTAAPRGAGHPRRRPADAVSNAPVRRVSKGELALSWPTCCMANGPPRSTAAR